MGIEVLTFFGHFFGGENTGNIMGFHQDLGFNGDIMWVLVGCHGGRTGVS